MSGFAGARRWRWPALGGAVAVALADWSVPNPSFGPVTTDDQGKVESLPVFAHA